MKPTIGRIVIFHVPVAEITSKINFAKDLPAIIVRVWADDLVNLKVITDGTEDVWKTSVKIGDGPDQWSWPVKEE
jgi:hypothetical protein